MAVIRSDKLHQLGFAYEYEPILLVVIAFNGLFKWWLYPAHLHFKEKTSVSKAQKYEPINHEDFVYALSHIDTFVDVTEEDLLEIYKLVTKRHVDSPQNWTLLIHLDTGLRVS